MHERHHLPLTLSHTLTLSSPLSASLALDPPLAPSITLSFYELLNAAMTIKGRGTIRQRESREAHMRAGAEGAGDDQG